MWASCKTEFFFYWNWFANNIRLNLKLIRDPPCTTHMEMLPYFTNRLGCRGLLLSQFVHKSNFTPVSTTHVEKQTVCPKSMSNVYQSLTFFKTIYNAHSSLDCDSAPFLAQCFYRPRITAGFLIFLTVCKGNSYK